MQLPWAAECLQVLLGKEIHPEAASKESGTACLRTWECSHCVDFFWMWNNRGIPRAASADSLISRQGGKLNEAGELKPDSQAASVSPFPLDATLM